MIAAPVIRPSALPALAQCPFFSSTEAGKTEMLDRGRDRHEAFAALVTGQPYDFWDALSAEEQESVTWAAEYVQMTRTDAPIKTEREISIQMVNDAEYLWYTGHIDATDETANIWDLKWRWRNYREQLNAYALGLMEELNLERVKVHVLYGECQKAASWEITLAEAEAESDTIIDEVIQGQQGMSRPRACDYCGWCANQPVCPEMTNRAEAIRAGREDWALEQYHASDIDDPEEMARALKLAREIKGWCESVEFHAKMLYQKTGALPGFTGKMRAGRRSISDLSKACALSGIPPEKFISVCSAPIGKLQEIYRAERGSEYTSKAASDRAFLAAVESVIEKAEDTLTLTPTKK